MSARPRRRSPPADDRSLSLDGSSYWRLYGTGAFSGQTGWQAGPIAAVVPPRSHRAPTRAKGVDQMFNTQVRTDEKPGSMGATPDELAHTSEANGKLHFEGAVQIDGTFTGSISTNDLLVIGEHAKIAADINCGSALVSGEVTGNITAGGAVELHKGAHVKGDISTPTLAIDKGAVFDGLSKMLGAPATFGSLERRARPRNR